MQDAAHLFRRQEYVLLLAGDAYEAEAGPVGGDYAVNRRRTALSTAATTAGGRAARCARSVPGRTRPPTGRLPVTLAT
jgi:hypothetical protein